MNGAGSATSTQFLIVGPPSRLIGMDVFLDVIMRCVSDTVAAKAIAFITALPSRLAPHLTGPSPNLDSVALTLSSGGGGASSAEAGQGNAEQRLTGEELTALRTLLLEQCISQLSLTQGLGLGKGRQGDGDDVSIAVSSAMPSTDLTSSSSTAAATTQASRNRVLKRLLKLLNSLLEESLGDLGVLRPHGGLARGYDITITVTGANKFKGTTNIPS